MVRATVQGGRLEIDVPADWPDGTEVEVYALEPGIQDAAGMMSAEEIAQTLAAMDQVEPLEITATERAAWEAERKAALGVRKHGLRSTPKTCGGDGSDEIPLGHPYGRPLHQPAPRSLRPSPHRSRQR